MSFTKVYNFPGDRNYPEGRVYQHSFGKELFNDPLGYATEALSKLSEGRDFFVSILWGEGGRKNMDFVYWPKGSMMDWRSNMEPESLLYKNGIWRIVSEVTCEEGFMLIGREMENRRKSSCLEEFSLRPLDLNMINLALDFGPKGDPFLLSK